MRVGSWDVSSRPLGDLLGVLRTFLVPWQGCKNPEGHGPNSRALSGGGNHDPVGASRAVLGHELTASVLLSPLGCWFLVNYPLVNPFLVNNSSAPGGRCPKEKKRSWQEGGRELGGGDLQPRKFKLCPAPVRADDPPGNFTHFHPASQGSKELVNITS